MDKKSIIEIIMDVYKSLTPTKVSIFQKNEEVINIRVVSEIFSGMTFSSRFKFLNQILKDQQPDLFSKHIYVFEAFTSGEAKQVTISHNDESEESNLEKYKESAKGL